MFNARDAKVSNVNKYCQPMWSAENNDCMECWEKSMMSYLKILIGC